ncbi:MAG: nitroreductase family protein [Candidatus Didemnitutus sp.]|nr:nitroreductase family protein [Candidatus Didemnitutus sp.]
MSLTPLSFETHSEDEMRRRAQDFYLQIRRRHTVRDFSDRPVPREIIADCLRAAGTAPNGANLQPWHFAVIGDPAVKRRLREAAEAEEREFYGGRAPDEWLDALAPFGTGPDKPFLETAPWIIAIFACHNYTDAAGEKHPTYYPKESTGIACGFLIAALHHAGLATLTHTPSPMNFLNEICGRPPQDKPFLVLVVGYPGEAAQVPALAKQKKSLDEISTWL